MADGIEDAFRRQHRGDAPVSGQGLSSFLCEVVRFLVVGEVDATGKRDREYV